MLGLNNIIKTLISLTSLFLFIACSEKLPITQPSINTVENFNNFHENKSYSIVLEEVLNGKVCRRNRPSDCSRTKRLVALSRDGFIFEYFQSDSRDNVYCSTERIFPCAAQGDYGGGKTELNVWKFEGKEKSNETVLRFINETSPLKIDNTSTSLGAAVISREEKSENYPYLVIKRFSGGISCCIGYEFYLKQNLTYPPYVIEYSRNDILYTYREDDDTFRTIHPGSGANEVIGTEDITNLLEVHFMSMDMRKK